MMPQIMPFNDDDIQGIAAWLGADCPTTYAVHTHCRDESEWLTARGKGIGASEVGVIVGASQYSSPYALWWRKKLDWHIPSTESQRWGHLVEDPIAELFAEQMDHDLYVAKPLGHPYSLWSHPISPWALCTPDRLAVRKEQGDIVPVEIKSDEGGPGWGEPGTDEVPEKYRCQALWQAFVFGAAGTYVVRKRSSGRGRVRWYWVPWDEAELTSLFVAADEFLESLAHDEPPEPDDSDATTEALKERFAAVEDETYVNVDIDTYADWITARHVKAEAIRAEKAASNRLRAAMGTAMYATYTTDDGLEVTFAKRRVSKKSGYTVEPGMVDELRMVGNGQHAPSTPLPGGGSSDSPTATPPDEERHLRGDVAGSELGHADSGTPKETAAGEDPGGTALDVPTCTCVHSGLPPVFHKQSCALSQTWGIGDAP